MAVVLTLAFALAGASAAEARLVFKRPDGSVIPFTAKPRVWCGPWDTDVRRRSIHVAVPGAKRHWDLSAVRRDIKVGRRIKFPLDFVFNRPRGALLFAADSESGIEASTAEEEASGSMVFTRVTCRRHRTIEFSVHAVLGSEFFEGDSVQVDGTFRGRVGKAPRHALRAATRVAVVHGYEAGT